MKLMKYIFVLISVTLSTFVNLYSQNVEHKSEIPVDEMSGLITYQDVVQTIGNRQELFKRAIGWVNSFYANPTDATRVRNPESGIIEILHRFKVTHKVDDGMNVDAGIISYVLKIELRDNRYRYTMNNFTLRQASRFPVERWLDKADRAYNPNWDIYLEQINDFAQNLVDSLADAMKPEAKIEDDEW